MFLRVGTADFTSFASHIFKALREAHCMLCKYCVSERQVYERYNMLLLSHLLMSSAALLLFWVFPWKVPIQTKKRANCKI